MCSSKHSPLQCSELAAPRQPRRRPFYPPKSLLNAAVFGRRSRELRSVRRSCFCLSSAAVVIPHRNSSSAGHAGQHVIAALVHVARVDSQGGSGGEGRGRPAALPLTTCVCRLTSARWHSNTALWTGCCDSQDGNRLLYTDEGDGPTYCRTYDHCTRSWSARENVEKTRGQCDAGPAVTFPAAVLGYSLTGSECTVW